MNSSQSSTNWSVRDAELELVPCPLCGHGRFETLCETDRYDHGLTTVGCLHCGLVMTNPQPSAAALDEFYARYYRHYYQKVEQPSLEYIRRYRKDERAGSMAQFIHAHDLLPADASVLDVGGSEGCILKALRDLERGIRAISVEPNPEFGAFARTHADCEVYAELEQVPLDRRFDLIVMNHVYEHIKQPRRFLETLRARLSPRGRLYVDVPDLSAYTRLDSLHVAHLYHFSEETLRRVAESAGYEVELIERHAPIEHPLSLRIVMAASERAAPPAATYDWNADWDRVRHIRHRAARYHRRRWSWIQRFRYRLSCLTQDARIVTVEARSRPP